MRKVNLPDGAKLYIATALGTLIAPGTATNATETVVSVTNTLIAGALVMIDSDDWPELNATIAKVKAATASTVTLEGVNTSDTNKFPSGGKLGILPVGTAFQRLPYVPSFAISGGEIQTSTANYLDIDDGQEYKTGRSGRRLQYTMSWNKDGAARAALLAQHGRSPTIHRLTYRDGSSTYYVGELDYNDAPSTEKGNEMVTTSTVLLLNAPSFVGA